MLCMVGSVVNVVGMLLATHANRERIPVRWVFIANVLYSIYPDDNQTGGEEVISRIWHRPRVDCCSLKDIIL